MTCAFERSQDPRSRDRISQWDALVHWTKIPNHEVSTYLSYSEDHKLSSLKSPIIAHRIIKGSQNLTLVLETDGSVDEGDVIVDKFQIPIWHAEGGVTISAFPICAL
jgi:hypothetical protein